MGIPVSTTPANRQSGVMLLEALVGILIFTIGLIGLLGMQTMASQATAAMKYRSEAGALAEELINQMWVGDRQNLQAGFSAGGANYQDWFLNRVVLNTTITVNHPTATGLPGVAPGVNQPVVNITQGVAPTPTTVTVIVYWQDPHDPVRHRYESDTSLPPL